MNKTNYKNLIKKEIHLFKKEYDSYFIKDESKPKKIGKPFLLKNQSSSTGILIVHGLMAAPFEVRKLGEFLTSKGYTVYAPRLAGHGTSFKDLSFRKYEEWLDSVERGYEVLSKLCDEIIIAGFSTGAGLALYHVLNKPDKYRAVISISAPFKFKGFSFCFTELVNYWNKLTENKKIKKFRKVYVKNNPDNPHINYNRCPVSSLAEVRALMRKVNRSISRLSIPSLIVQAENDPKVDCRTSRSIFSKIRNSKKDYYEVDFDRHGIVNGKITDKIFPQINAFLNKL